MNRPNSRPGSNGLLAAVALLFTALGCAGTVIESGATDGAGSTAGNGSNQGGGTSVGGAGVGGDGVAGSSSPGSAGAGVNPPAGPRPVNLTGEPIYSRFLRLTNDQWENSVHDILNLSAPTGASGDFLHAVSGTTDFSNNERVVYVDNDAWSDFQTAAETVADQVTATDAALQKVVQTTDAATFIKTFGRRAFRRDLSADEIASYTDLFNQGSTSAVGTQSAFTKGANWVIDSMLQSPNFLYRQEMGDSGKPLSGYEMAAKLSLWLRDTTPTDAMLDAAAEFATADGAATRAAAMLDDDAATAVMRKFHGELYKFDLFDSIAKTGVDGYSDTINPELKESSYLFFDRIFSQGLGLADVLTSNVGFAGPGLATLYGVTIKGTGLQQVTLDNRSGFFAQIPFLTLWARNNTPDSIHRGVRINLDTLCADPGLPSSVLPSIPAPKPNQTNRQVVTDLTSGCGSVCHGQIINPIGFAFENFDGLGRFRSTDNGSPVDTSGTYPFAEGSQTFADSSELMQEIAQGSQAHQCWAKKMASYALERDLVESDRPLVEALGAVSLGSGASLKDVMLALVKSDAFRTRVGGAQ